MAKTRVAVEFGMGTSIRKQDYTGAAKRGLKDALWHNSLSVADMFGFDKDDMLVDVEIAVQKPNRVDLKDIERILPYGKSTFKIVNGGLDVPKPNGDGVTVIASVAVIVSFDMERTDVK